MDTLVNYIIAFCISLIVTLITTPIVKHIAVKYGFVDKPDHRKVHQSLMPRLGGLAIVFGVIAGFIYLKPQIPNIVPASIGALIILAIGILDDKYTLSAKVKFIGQILAASIVVFSGIDIDFITFPFGDRIELGTLGVILSILWIVGVTNAINLIDGLDGLAGGVSAIAIGSILAMSVLNNQFVIVPLCIILIGSIIGFLYFNFHPAKIFMGDTGALFLGYSIAVISMMGLFKSVTLFSLIIPIIILGIPIFDTFFAIVRRVLNKQRISAPDKSHLHHCLIAMGFSHRKTVLIIYGIGILFGFSAIIFSTSTLWVSLIIIGVLIIVIQLTAEIIGLIGKRKPLINMIKRMSPNTTTTRMREK
ncbi:glycosyltransferase family 4 protein [Bacillus weihaiensis]|uniref:Undecaprenyl-phosphate alpha-N-acetylglucosaminyl 1-phosphate transferase n=1 Tax=Bacillus weihaiensis TaxID=1547283 RepID=A0A1L3MMS7_9BACI|nr:MraY family glycosyltransferase [Bacillus weihaiensis]APH03564.1 undecaprenyl-phosphate alpha-N-acetylglucosaminyl 1-phosphate transferase [Bacillus weihaiensis]